MLTRVLDNPRVANVIACLALFIALGTSGAYAASKLKANSVGSREIKTGAIHSSELYDGGILLKDINKSTRAALRGATGPAGPAGPAGASAVKHFAAVSAAGAFLAGDAKVGGRSGAVGSYTVSFGTATQPVSLAGCAPVASLGSSDGSAVPAGKVNASRAGDVIQVQTYDAANAAADLPFNLAVLC